jgi:hypothetical protein
MTALHFLKKEHPMTAVHWPVSEWETLGRDELYTFLMGAPEAVRLAHPEAYAAYLLIAAREEGVATVLAALKFARAWREAGAPAEVAPVPSAPVEVEPVAERSALPLPPRALIDRLLSLPEYQARGHGVELAGETPRGDTPAACTQRYILDNIESGRSSDFYCLPLLYRHEGELWLSIDDQYDIEGEGACDPPQRVRALTPIAATDLIAVVGEDELFLMYRRDVEVQIGAQAA